MSVKVYGRLWFTVSSNSRPGMVHFVDLEPETGHDGLPLPYGEPYACSCESFNLRLDRPCRHCIEVLAYIRKQQAKGAKKKTKPSTSPATAPDKPKRQYKLKPRTQFKRRETATANPATS